MLFICLRCLWIQCRSVKIATMDVTLLSQQTCLINFSSWYLICQLHYLCLRCICITKELFYLCLYNFKWCWWLTDTHRPIYCPGVKLLESEFHCVTHAAVIKQYYCAFSSSSCSLNFFKPIVDAMLIFILLSLHSEKEGRSSSRCYNLGRKGEIRPAGEFRINYCPASGSLIHSCL